MLIDGNPAVNSSVSIPTTSLTISNLTITAGDSLSLLKGSYLHVLSPQPALTLNNAGSLNLDTGAQLVVTGNLTTAGGGTINLASGGKFDVIGSFTNADQTINASGSYGFQDATNNGTIRNMPGQDLSLAVPGDSLRNGGLIAATGGGTFRLGNVVNSSASAGTLQAGPDSTLSASVVHGGNIQVLGNGSFQLMDVELDASIVNSPTGHITVFTSDLDQGSINNPAGGQIDANTLQLSGGSDLVNAGTLSIGQLIADAPNLVLRGGGQIEMRSGTSQGVPTIRSINEATVINMDQTIEGRGSIPGPFFNGGVIDANLKTGPLMVGIAQASFVNDGTIRASNGGQLIVYGSISGTGAWTADGGTITVSPGGRVNTLGPIDIRNAGALQIEPGAGGSVTATNLAVDASSSISVQSNLKLFGNFSYATTDPTQWSWGRAPQAGGLIMDGCLDAGPGSTQGWATLELGEKDNGPTGPGFDTSLSIPSLTIGPGAHVMLEDLLDNGNRGGPAGSPEALYVDRLYFADSTGQIDLNGLHLYYHERFGGSAAQFVDVPEPTSLGLVLIAVTALGWRVRT